MFLRRSDKKPASASSSHVTAAGIYGAPVGTEALAAQNLEWNAHQFQYPAGGFFCRLEHTLLYSMIRESNVFPASVVKDMIQQEEFENYLFARPTRGTTTTGEPDVSYAQLSAIMVLAGSKWEPKTGVPEALCKKILKTVIAYAEEKGLDRQEETQELLKPLVEYAQQQEHSEALSIVLPFYIGVAATAMTGNPMPLLACYAYGGVKNIQIAAQEYDAKQNIHDMVQATKRSSNIENASLLEECEE